MIKLVFTLLCIFGIQHGNSQTIYVDAVKGNDSNNGSMDAPVATLEKAVSLSGFTIKLAPGFYQLKDVLKIGSMPNTQDTTAYIIEASVMPDDSSWQASSMPVIQSVSANNNFQHFKHSVGLQIERNHVRIRGLKFVGNPNPTVKYYYPIERDNHDLDGLDVSQCYFIGEKNTSPVQGAMYTQGAGIHVDHCIFFNCKNALLVFDHIKDLSLTYSVIYGAYESAAWFGNRDTTRYVEQPFVFRNNIISNCNYVWVVIKPSNIPVCRFTNSLITGNTWFLAVPDTTGGLKRFTGNEIYQESNLVKYGRVQLSEVMTEGIPKDYLNPIAGSAGYQLNAGIFKH